MEHVCVWCNKRSETLMETKLKLKKGYQTVYVCDKEHEKNSQKFIDDVIKYGMVFFICTMIFLVIGVLALLYNDALGTLILFAGIGVTFFVFPFTRKHTAILIGIKNSIIVARVFGVIMVIIGIILGFAIWYFG
jgi:hypothetical protein